MRIIKELGHESLVDYIIRKSTLKKDQFTLAKECGDAYVAFIVAQNNKLLFLGRFSYDRFIRRDYGTEESDLIAITRFLDLCIKKLEDEKIEVPTLTYNPESWDACYRL